MPLEVENNGYNLVEIKALELLSGISLQPNGQSLVATGQVYEVVHTGQVLRVFLDIDNIEEAQQELLAETLVSLLNEIPSVERVIVKPKPVSVSKGRRLAGVNRVIAIHSGKGGVGKSTLTVQLALLFAQRGLKVGVLDADIYGPSLPTLIGASSRISQDSTSKKMIPVVALGIRLMSLGFLLPEDQALVWRGSLVDEGLSQFFTDVDWGELDILLVDLPPGTSDVHLAALRTTEIDGVITVSAPGQVSLDDVRRGMEMFADLAVPCLGLVENFAGIYCQSCKHINHFFGENGAAELAQETGVPLLASIPFYPEIAEAADTGRLYTLINPDSAATKYLLPIVERLASVFPELGRQTYQQQEATI